MADTNVCRFFLEGRCKFGDRCRYLHPTGGGRGRYNNQRGYRHQPNPSFDTGRRWDRKPDGNRFQLFSNTTHSSNNRGGGGGGGSGYRDWGKDSNRGGWTNRGGRNSWDNQRDFRGGQSSNYRYSDSQYRTGTRGGRSQYSNQSYDNRFQNQSPYESNSRYRRTQEQATSTDPRDLADQIRSDMDEWEKYMIWPLSCYAYRGETPCLPGFSDVSPEEVRWEAYQAKIKNTSEEYLKQIRELSDKHFKILNMYAYTTPDDVAKLQSGQLPSSPLFGSQGSAVGSNIFSPSTTGSTVSSLFGPSSSLQTTTPLFGSNTQTLSLFQNTNQSSTTIQSPSTVTSSSSLFSNQQSLSTSQQTPSSQTQQTPLSVAPSGTHLVSATTNIGTDQLSKDELDAFKADKFILKHIPEHAPTKELS